MAAQYGRRSASYLGLNIKEGNLESTTVDGQADLLGLTINYDGTSHFLKNTSLFASARYQDFSLLFNMLNLKQVGYPKYGDFILKSNTDLNSKNKLSIVAIISPESFVRNIGNVREDQKLDNLSLVDVSKNKTILGVNLKTLTSKNSYWKNIVYYTKTALNGTDGIAYPKTDSVGNLIDSNNIPYENGIQTNAYSESKIGLRSIFNVHLSRSSQLLSGIDIDGLQLKSQRMLKRPDTLFVYRTNDFKPSATSNYAVVDPIYFNVDFNKSAYNVSAYVDYSLVPFAKLTINTGVRYDYSGFTSQHTFSPRLSGSCQLTGKSNVNFAVGIYYQDPDYTDIAGQPEGNKLQEEKVTQFILGYRKYFTSDLKLTVETWYKNFGNMVVRPISGYEFQNNQGTGWSNGIDISLIKRLSKKIHGQIGYSYMQSKRNDHDGYGEYNFAFSQPHQVNVLVSYKADKHWIISSKFRYVTGKPTDAYIIHYNVFNNPSYLRYSEEIIGNNQARLPDFIS